MTGTGFVVVAVGGGVVVIVVAVCVVLIVLLVTLAMRTQGKQAAQRRGERTGSPEVARPAPTDARDSAVDRAQDELERIRERDDG